MGIKAGPVNRANVLKALSCEQYVFPRDIAPLVGINEDAIRKHLRALCRDGKAERTSMGYRRAA